MDQSRRRVLGRTGALTLIAALLLVSAGVGVVRFIDNSSSYAHSAADAAAVSEQLQVLAVVAAQASLPASDIPAIRATGLAAGIKARKTLDRLIASGMDRNDVRPLDKQLIDYFASLAAVEQLFTDGHLVEARLAAADTGTLVAPITARSHEMERDLRARADTTSRVARLGSLSLLIFAVGTITILTALVERRRRREAIAGAGYSARARFEAMVEHSADLVIVMDHTHVISYVSPALHPMLGYERDAWVGTRQNGLIHADDQPVAGAAFERVVASGDSSRLDVRFLHADGALRILDADVARLATPDGEPAIVWTVRDVTAQRVMEEQLRRQAFEDSLTGLANRAVLHDRLTQAIARAGRSGGEIAVLLLDVDNFKAINDSFGHSAGDTALVYVAAALNAAVREGDTLARLGGDEFVIVAEDASGHQVAEMLAARIHAELPRTVLVDGSEVRLSASIGAVVTTAPTSTDEVLREADLAMYKAKTLGPGRTVFFEGQMLHDAQTRLDLGNELDRALEREELELHYQPIVDLTTSAVVGAEALLRWHHPVRGAVPPDVFIPIAERSDAIISIGAWVLAEACRQTAVWSATMPGQIEAMHVNVSAHQLIRPGFAADVARELQLTGIDPHVLVLELTESVFVDDGELVVQCIDELKLLGVRVAIDDFGTGYSSLSRLAQLPIDILKIDRSFVRAAGQGSANERRLVESVVSMTESMNLEPIAEGIEFPEDLACMLDAGCRYGQGYLLARPMPAADFFALTTRDLVTTTHGGVAR